MQKYARFQNPTIPNNSDLYNSLKYIYVMKKIIPFLFLVLPLMVRAQQVDKTENPDIYAERAAACFDNDDEKVP